MLSKTACPDIAGKSRQSDCKVGFAGKTFTLFTIIVIFLLPVQMFSQVKDKLGLELKGAWKS